MRDLLFGSIAQIVAAKGKTPVLLLKPIGAISSFTLRRILVPLDNESNHDAVLPAAQELSQSYKAQLDLLCVIPTRGTDTGEHAAAGSMLPMTAEEYLNMAEEIALEHFNTHLEEFSKLKITASAEIARGDPVNVILHTAEKDTSDMIIFGTHGNAGFKAFWNRSVAANVARQSNIPILLIPIKN
jgi:nucleotide-binding universal stress UspA family protein